MKVPECRPYGIGLFLFFIFRNLETDFIIIIRGNFFPIFVFYLDTIFIGICIPVRDGQCFSSFPIPLCFSDLITVFIIQGEVVITAFRHIHIDLDTEVILYSPVKRDGKVIEIHILFITEISFQTAGFVLNQKIQIQKCASLLLVRNLIGGMLSAISVIATKCTGVFLKCHIFLQFSFKKCHCFLSRHEKNRFLTKCCSICRTSTVYFHFYFLLPNDLLL